MKINLKSLLFLVLVITLFTITSFNCQKYDEDGLFQPNTSHRGNDTLPDEEVDTLAFTVQEIDSIMLGDTNTLMRILLIDNYEDSLILRTSCRDVRPDSCNEVLQHLIKRMYLTVADPVAGGVGLAAPQVGISRNIIWVQRYDKFGEPYEVFLNPQISYHSIDTVSSIEGCLSIPDTNVSVYRYKAVVVEYDKLDGTSDSELVEGFTARIFQHEIDHLSGILIVDFLGKKSTKILSIEEFEEYCRNQKEPVIVL